MKFGSTFTFKLQNLKEDRYVEYLTPLPGATSIWYWSFDQDKTDPAAIELEMGVKCEGIILVSPLQTKISQDGCRMGGN